MDEQQTETAPHPSDGMSLDEVAATLGFVSMLGTHHLQMSQGIHPTQLAAEGQTDPNASGESPAPVSSEKPQKEEKHSEEQDKEIADIRKELDELETEIKNGGKAEEDTEASK